MTHQKIKLFFLATVLLGSLQGWTSISSNLNKPSELRGGDHITMAACDFRSAMRKLWEDHITWTRLFIVTSVINHPETDTTTQRLLKNQVDLGNAIKPFYGNAAGNKLTDLLTEHILLAAKIVAAAKAGDDAAQNAATVLWYKNADDIALFLHQANPMRWPLAEMKAMMKDHLDLTTKELVAHLTGQWAADIAAYDKVHIQILEMADMLAFGIIEQFPGKFK